MILMKEKTSYKDKRYDLMSNVEGVETEIYLDSVKVPTIGIGVAFLTKDHKGTWVPLSDNIKALGTVVKMSPDELTSFAAEMQPFADAKNKGTVTPRLSSRVASISLVVEDKDIKVKKKKTEDNVKILFNTIVPEYERRLGVTLKKAHCPDELLTEAQRAALFSMVYQGRASTAGDVAEKIVQHGLGTIDNTTFKTLLHKTAHSGEFPGRTDKEIAYLQASIGPTFATLYQQAQHDQHIPEGFSKEAYIYVKQNEDPSFPNKTLDETQKTYAVDSQKAYLTSESFGSYTEEKIDLAKDVDWIHPIAILGEITKEHQKYGKSTLTSEQQAITTDLKSINYAVYLHHKLDDAPTEINKQALARADAQANTALQSLNALQTDPSQSLEQMIQSHLLTIHLNLNHSSAEKEASKQILNQDIKAISHANDTLNQQQKIDPTATMNWSTFSQDHQKTLNQANEARTVALLDRCLHIESTSKVDKTLTASEHKMVKELKTIHETLSLHQQLDESVSDLSQKETHRYQENKARLNEADKQANSALSVLQKEHSEQTINNMATKSLSQVTLGGQKILNDTVISQSIEQINNVVVKHNEQLKTDPKASIDWSSSSDKPAMAKTHETTTINKETTPPKPTPSNVHSESTIDPNSIDSVFDALCNAIQNKDDPMIDQLLAEHRQTQSWQNLVAQGQALNETKAQEQLAEKAQSQGAGYFKT